MKVLHIEDEVIVSLAMKVYLKNIGCEEVYSTFDSKKVFEILENHIIDTIILDIELNSDLNGIEIAKLINEKYSIPINFVSGHNSMNDYSEIKNVVKIITKPFNFNKIKNILEKIWK